MLFLFVIVRFVIRWKNGCYLCVLEDMISIISVMIFLIILNLNCMVGGMVDFYICFFVVFELVVVLWEI